MEPGDGLWTHSEKDLIGPNQGPIELCIYDRRRVFLGVQLPTPISGLSIHQQSGTNFGWLPSQSQGNYFEVFWDRHKSLVWESWWWTYTTSMSYPITIWESFFEPFRPSIILPANGMTQQTNSDNRIIVPAQERDIDLIRNATAKLRQMYSGR